MSTIGELAATLNEAPYEKFDQETKEAFLEVLDFLDTIPQDLDLASGAFYLRKEFKKNSTGIDDRYPVEVFTDNPEPYSGYDEGESWYDSSLNDDVEDDDYAENGWYCCEDCG